MIEISTRIPEPVSQPGSSEKGWRLARLRRGALALLCLLVSFGCASTSSYRDGTFRRPGVEYSFRPPDASWKMISFSGNDLAFAGDRGEVIAINSECEGHGDPSLKILSNHLLIGFENREILETETLEVAGREALRTRLKARLDGVPVDLELTVLKKDGCVYDLTYLAPPGRFDVNLDLYRSLVRSFETRGKS